MNTSQPFVLAPTKTHPFHTLDFTVAIVKTVLSESAGDRTNALERLIAINQFQNDFLKQHIGRFIDDLHNRKDTLFEQYAVSNIALFNYVYEQFPSAQPELYRLVEPYLLRP